MVNGQKWTKDGASVSFNGSSSYASPGASSTDKVIYEGKIINRENIEGTFTVTGSGGSGSTAFSHTFTGNFSIRKQQ